MNHQSAELNLVLAVTGIMLLVFGLFSAWMRRGWISGPAVAIAVGFLLGPAGFGLVASPLFSAHEATLLVTAETTLALGVVAAALHISPWLPAAASAQHRSDELIWTMASLVILASTVIHGMTAVPLTRLYGRQVNQPA